MSKLNPAPCIRCGAMIYRNARDKWRNAADGELHTCSEHVAVKNTDEQGETKSAPKEIPKAARYTCTECGMTGVSPMVVPLGNVGAGRCSNRAACAMRVRREKNKAKADKEKKP
jgi:predicted RNA-binding Zn-ribbon protein involved in translation (DUF1610 family)